MTYGRMPLFPPDCSGRGSSLRMPLFNGCAACHSREECQCVHIRNPVCPQEVAEVELCVDGDGNLSICVRRPPRACTMSRRHRHGCDCSPWLQ